MHIGNRTFGAPYSISNEERQRHIYITGATGTGKSTLLQSMMRADLITGRPFALLDPHGDLAHAVADSVPKKRTRDVLYLDPLDPEYVVGFNPIEGVPYELRSQAAANIVAAFEHIWSETWGARMEYVLLHTVRLLLDSDGTLLDINRVLTDDNFRLRLLRRSTDPYNRAFFDFEYAAYDKRFRQEVIAPIQNKVGQFTGNYHLRSILSERQVNVREAMGKYLIVNLNKAMGEVPSRLLGALLTSSFAQAAQARTIPERRDCTLYVDEFQNFATSAFETILSEARKYRLNLVIANQFASQIRSTLDAVLGNVSTVIAFRVSHKDAELLAPELQVPARTLATTPNYHAYVRGTQPTETVPVSMLRPAKPLGRFKKVRDNSRAKHGVQRKIVDRRIALFVNKPT